MRLRRGELTGGPAGAAVRGEAQRAMLEEAIADPEAIARLLCPWPTV
jgi:hypothetical protein